MRMSADPMSCQFVLNGRTARNSVCCDDNDDDDDSSGT